MTFLNKNEPLNVDLQTLQACALVSSGLRPVAQRRLFSDICITIADTIWQKSNLTALLCCFSTTHLATYVRSVSIITAKWQAGHELVSVNIPELQKALLLIANCHGYEMVNGTLVRRESPVIYLALNGLSGSEEQIHDLATIFPRLQKLELWDLYFDLLPHGYQVAFSETEEVTTRTLHGALTEFRCHDSEIAIPFHRLFPDNLPVNLHAIRFDLYSGGDDSAKQQWDNLVRRAGTCLHTFDVAFAGFEHPIHMSPRTSVISCIE